MALPHQAKPTAPATGGSSRQPAITEVLALWGIFAADAVAIFLTYANASSRSVRLAGRFDPKRGAIQVLVFARHPLFPAAIAMAPVAWNRLPSPSRPAALAAGTFSAAAAALPMMLLRRRQPTTGNAVDVAAVASIAFALGLSVESVRRAGVGDQRGVISGDAARLVGAVGLVAQALPWIFSDLGVYVTDLPVLGYPFLAEESTPEGGTIPAVHLGHHHGMDGTLLALTSVLLSRTLDHISPPPLREALSLYLAGMLVYGTLRAAEDVWNEQVVKRGRTSRKLPLLVRNRKPVGRRSWLAIIVSTVVLHRAWLRRPRHR